MTEAERNRKLEVLLKMLVPDERPGKNTAGVMSAADHRAWLAKQKIKKLKNR